jgi:octaprenyl-diphosphate synthase
VGDEKRIGKTLGTDLASGKFTLPLLHLFEGRDDTQRLRMAGLLRENLAHEDLLALLEREGALQRVREAFAAQLDAALSAIQHHRELPSHEPLAALADFVASQMNSLLSARGSDA